MVGARFRKLLRKFTPAGWAVIGSLAGLVVAAFVTWKLGR